MTRRQALLAGAAGAAPLAQLGGAQLSAPFQIQRWGIFEVPLQSDGQGNPFLDVTLSAEYRHEHRTVEVAGFHDGNSAWRIRFSPDAEGEWTFTTKSNRADLSGKAGRFVCVAPAR